jgi:REP element-mobilizing transposase RayT
VRFSGEQGRAVARGFAIQVSKCRYIVHACSTLPDHCHLVIARDHYPVEQVMNLLKGAASNHLVQEGLHPFLQVRDHRGRRPSLWSAGLWKVYLNTPGEIERAIRYVEDNPQKDGFRRQRWSFVTAYEPGPAGRR